MEFLAETRILGILLDGVQTILTDKRIKNLLLIVVPEGMVQWRATVQPGNRLHTRWRGTQNGSHRSVVVQNRSRTMQSYHYRKQKAKRSRFIDQNMVQQVHRGARTNSSE